MGRNLPDISFERGICVAVNGKRRPPANVLRALSLYRPDIAAMESDESICNHSDVTGFIKLNALRLRVKAMVERQAIREPR